MDRATRDLDYQLHLLKATDAVLSTNLILRLDGCPRVDQPNLTDPGVAVYFTLNRRDVVLACDRWNRVACNVWAISRHVDMLRAQTRYGVGTLDQAFDGYLALPAPSSDETNCWTILQLGRGERDSAEKINANYRALAEKYHPDRGGSDAEMAALNQARTEALATLGKIA